MSDQPTQPGDDRGPAGQSASPAEDLVRRILEGEDPEISPKERMLLERVGMPEQDAEQRSHTFTEVNLGFTHQLAILEAERCLQCKNAKCIDGCPVRVDIPRFIERLREGDMQGAAVHDQFAGVAVRD